MTDASIPAGALGGYRDAGDLTPKIELPVSGRVMVDGVEHLVERRLGDHWHLLSLEKDVLFLSDKDVAAKMAAGAFLVRHGDARTRDALSPLVVGEKAAIKNLKKYAYVRACLDLPCGPTRSRPALLPTIEAVAAQRGEKVPGFSTVLGWLDLYEAHGGTFGLASLSDRDDVKGKTGSRLPAWAEEAIAAGLEEYKKPQTTIAAAYVKVKTAVAAFSKRERGLIDGCDLYSDYRQEDGSLRPPCLRTFERRVADMDPIERDLARKGPAYVNQKYSTWQTLPLPDRPYETVEVDHCTLDIRVMDDAGVVFGRPDLVVFRDRATAMILGYGLGFEAPSYASFLQGLKSTYFPKDLSRFPAVTNPWPCVGRIENLHVDNALHFIGLNIRHAANEMGFNVTILPPKQPWLKGPLERFFGSLNTGLVHSLPGATLGDIKKRKEHEHLEGPTLTLEMFEALLVFWICQIYHARIHGGLGFIRGAGDVPLEVWKDKVAKYRSPPLPSPELFKSLAGDRATRVIGRQGIEWDRIFYESPELTTVLANPKHRTRSDDGHSTRYQVVRDPFDLGEISLIDHHANRVLKVPAAPAYRAYAARTTLHRHKVHLARSAERMGKQRVNIDDLLLSESMLQETINAIRTNPSQKKLRRGLARYLDGNELRHHRSDIAIGNPAAKEDRFLSASKPVAPSPPVWEPSPARFAEVHPEEDLDFLNGAPLESSYDD
ncbi:hypothetical protein [Brevundimonas naejangsanensis]|uniref:hypothetical protein n=1 Tax=Brevundimonas naejangsanensis TaxID=588932 RepID=UPI0034D763EB